MMKVRITLTNGQTLDATWDASNAYLHDCDLAFNSRGAGIEAIEILRYIPVEKSNG